MPAQRRQHRSPRQHYTPPQRLRRATPPVPQTKLLPRNSPRAHAAPTDLAISTLLALLNPRNTPVATAFTPQHNAHNNVHVECTSSPLACLPQRDDDLLLGCLREIGEGKSHAMAPFPAER
jgi:hypothetical protein